ncbi:MAG: radical SAM protein [Spirochaetales bacterium]|nr:radical SAM protein [Spirochaetales bacterium]MCF7939271.1 radical SAM protein [Spirochaetales bacterium]
MQEKLFGPIPSRRLGRSLGINNIPPKICSYSCVYCQIGRAIKMTTERSEFYPPQEIVDKALERVEELKNLGEPIDYLTFVPDGEPTLDKNLAKEIGELKKTGIPLALISNSSTISDPLVREELYELDWISLKVDAVTEAEWKAVDRPQKDLDLVQILDGIREFAADFSGVLTTETMLIEGKNDGDAVVNATAGFLEEIEPDIAYIAIPTRPPAEPWCRPAPEERLVYAYTRFASVLPRVEHLIGYEGNEFSHTGDARTDILSITGVHPMREDAVAELLEHDNAEWEVVNQLIEEGLIITADYNEHRYYSRKFREKQRG